MAKLVLTNAYVKVGTVDLSDHVNQVTISRSANEVETTAFGDTYTTRVGGLKEASVSLTFHNDYVAGEVQRTIGTLIGELGTVVVGVNGSVASTATPLYECVVLFSEWSDVDGSVGDLSTASVTWPANSILEKLS